ncbi:hypothetical protein D3C72_2326430 [compost metagenome]
MRALYKEIDEQKEHGHEYLFRKHPVQVVVEPWIDRGTQQRDQSCDRVDIQQEHQLICQP